MENHKTKMEFIYLLWHKIVGSFLLIFLVLSLIDSEWLFLVLLGLLPQGIFQMAMGMIALLKPNAFRLVNRTLLFIWFTLSIAYLLAAFLEPAFLETRNYGLSYFAIGIVIPMLLASLQVIALTATRFKSTSNLNQA